MNIEVPNFEKLRLLVVGDVMLDRYWYGNTSRISPEAPVPVVHINDLEERAGGAGNVALNLSTLGCQVSLLGIVGNDSAANKLMGVLKEAGVNCIFERLESIPTITKVRVLGRNQQLLRLDFEEILQDIDYSAFHAHYQSLAPQFDAIILSDYGKGTLKHAAELISIARKLNIPVLVDPKSKDFSTYQHATIVTPNFKEFEAVVGACSGERELVSKGHDLVEAFSFDALLVTRGEQGMSLLERGQEAVHLPTKAQQVYDVTGAGDTVIAVFAAVLAAGRTMVEAATLANMAAGIVVRKLGAATVSVPELRRALQRQYGSEFGVLTEDELVVAVEDARAHGEKIVMTNGCFDILHAGHIQYLEQAKELGKRLVVAVNDDSSVGRLKGADRPINPLRERMAVLAALRAVDWVVSFSEDTPERIIQLIKPDVLVKGGDYLIKDIVGSDFVLRHGGEVKSLAFAEGFSTTNIITRARRLA